MESKPKARQRSRGSKREEARVPPRPTAPVSGRERSVLYRSLLICFALSGATGLVYQVLWGRMLVLVFGATTAATGTVLAVFMGGLALGGWLAGRRADTLRRPLLAYGLLEGGIGLCALSVPLLFDAAVPVYRLVWRATEGAGLMMVGLRFALACIALLPATLLMGATLPVLSRVSATRPETLGARLGALYGANTLGAASGAFLAGFVLIPSLGVSATTRATALTNLALLSAALWLEKSFGTARPGSGLHPLAGKAAPPPVSKDRTDKGARLVARMALVGFGVSGAIALVYEVSWTRALLLVIGSNVQAFATMLTTVLIGLVGGTLVAARVADRVRRPLAALAWAEVCVALSAWLGYCSFDSLPWVELKLLEALPRSAPSAMLTRFGLAATVMLPSTLCLGALFPLAVRACRPAMARVGRTVGDLYAANTFGAIAGSLLASFILISRLGTETTLHVAMAANVALGMVFLLASARGEPGHGADPSAGGDPASITVRLTIMAGTLVLVAWPIRWDTLLIVMAQPTRRELAHYLTAYPTLPYGSRVEFVRNTHASQKLLWSAEGLSSHVAVIRNPVNTTLLTNGHSDGSDNLDMPTQIELAALPMLLHPAEPAPASVAVVGWGTGVTGGVVLQFPVEHVTALELEPEVLRAADFFRHVNHDALRDPRVRLILADGRNVFLSDQSEFDVIISEPSNVWQAGVCNLFTREYFQLCRARLKPDGLFTQWIGYGAVATPEVRGILAAIRQVFPHALLFRVDEFDAVLVASGQPLAIDVARVRARIEAANAALKSDLRRAGIPSVAQIIANLLLGSDELAAFCGEEPPNTDDNARLEFTAARAYEQRSYSEEGGAAFAALRPQNSLEYVRISALSAEEQVLLRKEVFRAQPGMAAPRH